MSPAGGMVAADKLYRDSICYRVDPPVQKAGAAQREHGAAFFTPVCYHDAAGWSSLVARWAHNPKVGGSNPPPATNGR